MQARLGGVGRGERINEGAVGGKRGSWPIVLVRFIKTAKS